jgi:hypothetical protein
MNWLMFAILIAVGIYGLFRLMFLIVPPVIDAVMWIGQHVDSVIPHVVIWASASLMFTVLVILANMVGQVRPFPRMRKASYWGYFLSLPIGTALYFGYLANSYSNLLLSATLFFIWGMMFGFVQVMSLKPFDLEAAR